MMQDYTAIPQKRLQQIAKHYISHARMQIMEGKLRELVVGSWYSVRLIVRPNRHVLLDTGDRLCKLQLYSRTVGETLQHYFINTNLS